jgi:hypothetical protein
MSIQCSIDNTRPHTLCVWDWAGPNATGFARQSCTCVAVQPCHKSRQRLAASVLMVVSPGNTGSIITSGGAARPARPLRYGAAAAPASIIMVAVTYSPIVFIPNLSPSPSSRSLPSHLTNNDSGGLPPSSGGPPSGTLPRSADTRDEPALQPPNTVSLSPLSSPRHIPYGTRYLADHPCPDAMTLVARRPRFSSSHLRPLLGHVFILFVRLNQMSQPQASAFRVARQGVASGNSGTSQVYPHLRGTCTRWGVERQTSLNRQPLVEKSCIANVCRSLPKRSMTPSYLG